MISEYTRKKKRCEKNVLRIYRTKAYLQKSVMEIYTKNIIVQKRMEIKMRFILCTALHFLLWSQNFFGFTQYEISHMRKKNPVAPVKCSTNLIFDSF